MAKHINECSHEIIEMFTATSMLLTVNEHTIQLERVINGRRKEYNILFDTVMDSQKGMLQPHIIMPAQIVKQMKASQADILSELSLPVPLSATYQT